MSVRLLTGDCREVLASLSDTSVHCVVTSPPYFGLRDYGTGQWEGGDAACDHVAGMARQDTERETPGGRGGSFRGGTVQFRDECRKCGAGRTDRQIGLEQTPDAYVAELVAVFREVRRVLRDDGTLWLNLGDSYAMSTKGAGGQGKQHTNAGSIHADRSWRIAPGLKPKDLIGIPWLVAFALRADGWYLRSDIIWSKPNPMPESVRDRPTKAHEYLFLLSKAERYYFDQEAVKENALTPDRLREKFNGESAVDTKTRGWGSHCGTTGGERNIRSVWTVATQPFSEAHFATFPPDLIEPCIKAGCPAGGTVLDPFGGAGTTGLVADRLQRSAILIELNPDYAAMADKRIRGDAGMFAEVA